MNSVGIFRFFGFATWIFLMLSASPVAAQPHACPTEFKFASSSGYAFHGVQTGTIRSFGSTTEAVQVVKRITDSIGLPVTFTVCEAALPNAHAILTSNGKRYIAYSKTFMQNLQAATGGKYWSLISVMAHEVGHHLAFHNYDNTEAHKAELEADFFSGFIVKRLGASLDEAEAAMRTVASPVASATHPGLKERLQAIASGWSRAATNGVPNTRPAPDQSSATAPATTVRIRKLANHYVEGDGYSKMKTSSYAACEAQCLADARCLTMEFFRPGKMCNLYALPGKPSPSKDADIGMKAAGVTSLSPVAAGRSISRLASRYVEGDGYAKFQAMDYEACADRCKSDTRCLLVEYFKPTQTCNLFDQIRNHFPSKEADIGVRM